MAKDPATLLDALETAILAFYTNGAAQSYTHDGTTVTVANIESLEKLRDKLRAEVSRGKVGGTTNYFRRGSA